MAKLEGSVSEILRLWRDVVYISLTDRKLSQTSFDKGWRSRTDFKWVVIINLFATKYNCMFVLSCLSKGHGGLVQPQMVKG